MSDSVAFTKPQLIFKKHPLDVVFKLFTYLLMNVSECTSGSGNSLYLKKCNHENSLGASLYLEDLGNCPKGFILSSGAISTGPAPSSHLGSFPHQAKLYTSQVSYS